MNLVQIAEEGARLSVWAVCSGDPNSLECDALDFLSELERSGARAAHMSMWRTITDLTNGIVQGTDKCVPEGDGIYALKNRQGARLLFFYMKGGMAVVTHGYPKKTRKLPAGEKKRAVTVRDRVKEEFGD